MSRKLPYAVRKHMPSSPERRAALAAAGLCHCESGAAIAWPGAAGCEPCCRDLAQQAIDSGVGPLGSSPGETR